MTAVGLLEAIADLPSSTRRAMCVAVAELRDGQAAGGDHRSARVFAELAAVLAEAESAETELVRRAAAGPPATLEDEGPRR